MTFWQTISQAVAEPQTRGFLIGLTTAASAIVGTLALLYRGLVSWMRDLKADVTSVREDVGGFQTILASHEREDVKRFSEIETRANDRHEAVLAAVQRHADVVAVPLAVVQLETAKLDVRMTALEVKRGKR